MKRKLPEPSQPSQEVIELLDSDDEQDLDLLRPLPIRRPVRSSQLGHQNQPAGSQLCASAQHVQLSKDQDAISQEVMEEEMTIASQGQALGPIMNKCARFAHGS